MSAKEMFEKLGYKQYIETNRIGYIYEEVNVSIYFVFSKKFYIVHSMGNAQMIDIELHNAITQQMKELNWL